MASTLPLDFSVTHRPPSNPWAEFVDNTPSTRGHLGLERQPEARPSPDDRAGSVGHLCKPFLRIDAATLVRSLSAAVDDETVSGAWSDVMHPARDKGLPASDAA
jgi:hypothetical protein